MLKIDRVIAAVFILFIGGSQAPTAQEIDLRKLSGNITLTLKHGLWKLWEEEPVYQDITLDLACNQGKCDSEVWGYAPKFNQDVDHQGTIVQVTFKNDWQMQIKMNIQAHPWQPQLEAATYDIQLVLHQGKLLGSYQGDFNKRSLQGQVKGTISPLFPQPIANHQPLRQQEHPRLIFRANELPTLRAKSKTPAGQAILAQLNKTLQDKVYYDGYVPNGGYHAAGYCLLSLLNEDKKAADTGWQLVKTSMERPGKRLLEHSPIVAGVALAYDLCYQNWDEERLKIVTSWLGSQADWLTKGGSPSKGWNNNAWSNWNARARGASGLAALAILEEPDRFFDKPVDAEHLYKRAERNLKRYLTIAIGEHGLGTEGDHYTTEPWVLTIIPFLQAYENVVGKDLVTRSSGEWFLPHYLMRIVDRSGELSVPTYGRHRYYAGGSLFSLGLGLVPEKFLPGVMWLFDRHLGMQGDKTFGISSPYQAAFILKGYPAKIVAQNPATIFDRVLVDNQKGFYVFRDRWQDSNDFVASIYLQSQPLGGSWSFPDVGSFRIWGLGGRWATAGLPGGKWEEENTVVMPKTRPWKSSEPIFFISNDDGSGVVSLRTDNIVLKNGNSPVGIGLVRSFAVDYSQASGSPGLFVVVDKFIGLGEAKEFEGKTWVMNTEGNVSLDGQSFTIQANNGVTLKGTFITPNPVKLSFEKKQVGGTIKATGGNEFFVVMTVQKGKVPPIKASGKGLDALVKVGNQTINFSSDRVFLEAF